MLESLKLTLPLIQSGGILDEAGKALYKDNPNYQDRLVETLFTTSLSLPVTLNGKANLLRSVPGHTVAGPYGVGDFNNPKQCDVVVIGKQPNFEELDNRRLFSKIAGNVWKDILVDLKVDFNDWYCVNACWFHVPDEIKFNKKYTKEFLGLLEATLKLIRPKYALLFGSEALKAFWSLKDAKEAVKIKLKDVRGAVLDINGVKAIASYSPNHVIMDPTITFEFKRDLESFVRLVQGKEAVKTRPKDTVHYIDNQLELTQLVDKLIAEGYTRFAVDTETGNGNWKTGQIRTIQFAWGSNSACVVILRREGMVPAFTPSIASALVPLIKLFKRPGVTIVGHNARFDLKWLIQYGLDLTSEFIEGGFDTMLGHHLLYETADQQLELVGVKLLGFPRYDLALRTWLDKEGIDKKTIKKLGYAMVPDELLHPYGAMDTILTLELDKLLTKELAKVPELDNLYKNIVHRVNLPLLEMEMEGINVDMDRLRTLISLFLEKQIKLKKELQDRIKWPDFNPRSPDNTKEVLFSWFKEKDGVLIRKAPEDALLLELKPVKATDDTPWDRVEQDPEGFDKYNPSTDSESLGILAAEHDLASDLRNFKVIDQMLKNFLRPEEEDDEGDLNWDGGIGGAVDPDNKLRTNFRQTTDTGRYASSPNCQNYPSKQEGEFRKIFTASEGAIDPRYKGIKSVIVASPGCVLLEADYSQAELFTMASLANDKDMLHTLETSDLHTEMVRAMFRDEEYKGKTIGEYKAGELNELRKTDKSLNSKRISAKSLVFGIPYGRGANAIVREVKKSGIIVQKADAINWMEAFHARFPATSAFLDKCKQAVTNPGYIVTPWGRYRRFPRTTDQRIIAGYQREAGNFPY